MLRRLSSGGIALAALVAGHCLASKIFPAVSGPHAMHDMRTASHSPYLVALFIGLIVAAIGSVADHRSGMVSMGWTSRARWLLPAQLVGFLVISLADSVTSAGGTEIGSRAFWAGLILQVLAASVGALTLTAFRRAIAAIENVFERPPSHTRAETRHSFQPNLVIARPRPVMGRGGASFRGPPALSI